MTSELFTSVLAWGGAVVTGVFTLMGVLLANRSSLRQLEVRLSHETERERREVLRKRLEELYSLVSQWTDQVVIHFSTYRRVMDGDLTYNEALDITTNLNSRVDASRLFALAELYFPTAHEELAEIKALRDKAAAIEGSFKEFYRNDGAPSSKHSESLTDILERFDEAIERYEAALRTYAQDV